MPLHTPPMRARAHVSRACAPRDCASHGSASRDGTDEPRREDVHSGAELAVCPALSHTGKHGGEIDERTGPLGIRVEARRVALSQVAPPYVDCHVRPQGQAVVSRWAGVGRGLVSPSARVSKPLEVGLTTTVSGKVCLS